MLQPYDPCPCGSGKKFRFCCQSFYPEINRAEAQFEQGQHQAALRMIDDVVKAHPQSTEALGTKARMLANLGKLEEADEVLEQAFTINPTYPNGLLMRAQLRLNEGETTGALLLARRAAEAYDPAAHGSLALVYHIIFENEMAQQRIVSAHVALNLAARCAPDSEQFRQILTGYFGPDSPLIEGARKTYTLRRPAATSPERQARWDAGLAQIAPTRLKQLATLCQEIANEDETDAAAWFNLGLAQAWLGENAAAIAALEKSTQHETDDALAREATILEAVLRQGFGMTEQTDFLQHGFSFQFRDGKAVGDLLNEWNKAGRLLVQPTEEQGTFSSLMLDVQKGIATSEGAATDDVGTFAAYLRIDGPLVRVRGPNLASVERIRDTFRERLSLAPGEAAIQSSPQMFGDLILPSLLFPTPGNTTFSLERSQEHVRRYFEETWLHQPSKVLAGNTPLDAVGSSVFRRKVAGLVDFMQQCCAGAHMTVADFNRIRHKLGLEPVPEPEPQPDASAGTEPGTTPAPSSAALKISEMNAADLAALDVATLTVPQLEQAQLAALKLKAVELARFFMETLVARPAEPERNDRYNFYSYLILRELTDGEPSKGLELAEAGKKFDAEHNSGARADEFDLRRGQVHAKLGQVDQAGEIFRGLFERSPEKAKIRIEAVETLIRLKQGKLARELAEAGLEVARERNDGDSQEAFTELAAAARKAGG